LIGAEIDMKKVLVVTRDELYKVSNSNAWWNEYDSVYYRHESENLDEFCIKDPAQILRMVIIVNDDRIQKYGLDTELKGICCGCI
jgi:hypothetical protein